MVRMIAHGSVEMRKEHLKENIGRDRIASGDELLRFEELLQVVYGRDNLVADRHDETSTDDKVDFLINCLSIFITMSREVEDEEGSVRVHCGEWRRRGRQNLLLDALTNLKLVCDIADLVFGRLFKINPHAASVFVAKYHASRIAWVNSRMLHFADMESGTSQKGIVARGISYALIAALAFGMGVVMGGGGSVAAVVSHVPLIGDGLDATPDQSVDLTDFWKAWNALNENYVLTHASSTLPSAKDRVFGAISGLASSYGDPYTVFFPPEEAKAFSDNISGSFGGVGMEIDVKDNALTVIAPLKGTPAEAAGIKAGDLIAAIDGKSTDGLSTEKAVRQIRGLIGTTIDFTIIRNGKALNIKVVRDTIQVPETKDSLDAASGVYSIALYQFTANSADLFNQTFSRFKASGAKKLIIDLRSNPGGYLDAAVDIASHFLPEGATIVTEDFDGKESNNVHTSLGYDDVPVGTKIVVLIDGGSASASEIFAGALQDADVATVMGTKSFGKGSVQTLIDIEKGSLKVTVARWITPSGNWIMGNGVVPDIEVAYVKADTPEEKDSQVVRAIKFLTTGK